MDEMHEFLEKWNVSKLTQKEKENPEDFITPEKIK